MSWEAQGWRAERLHWLWPQLLSSLTPKPFHRAGLEAPGLSALDSCITSDIYGPFSSLVLMHPNLWATGNSLLQILSTGNLIFLVLSGYLNPEVGTQYRNNKSCSCWLSECNLGIWLLVQVLLYGNSEPFL